MAQFPWYAEYRPGRLGGKPDALTRRSGDLPRGEGDERLAQRVQTLLKPENYATRQLEASELAISANDTPSADPPADNSDTRTTFEALLGTAYASDPFPNEVLELLRTGARHCKTISLAECSKDPTRRLRYRGKLYI